MRLYLLQLGLSAESGSPIPGYLIQTDDGSNILVDTGYPPGEYQLPGIAGGRFPAADYVVNRLAVIGVAPADIRYVVCTHLDPDHAGSHDAFPEAEFVIQREHYRVAREEGHQRFNGTRAHWDDPRLRYRLVDGDTELLPGIELIESSGHVPGLQTLLVRLPETGPVLLAIDAMSRNIAGYTPETRPIGPYDADEAGTRATTRKLLDLAAREGVTLTIYGHDPDDWKKLRKSPEYYQ